MHNPYILVDIELKIQKKVIGTFIPYNAMVSKFVEAIINAEAMIISPIVPVFKLEKGSLFYFNRYVMKIFYEK